MWYRCNPPVPQCLNAYNLQTSSFLADICNCAREQARLEVDAMTVAVPGGHSGHAPKGQSPGTSIYHIFLPSKPKPGLLDPLGPLAEVDFLSGFRALRDGSGPRRKNQGSTERTRAPRDGPVRQIRARRTNQGPARQIRARKTNQGPAGQIRDHGTDQGLAIRIGAPQDGSGPRTSNQGPNDQSGLRKTDQGPAG